MAVSWRKGDPAGGDQDVAGRELRDEELQDESWDANGVAL